VKMRGLAVGLVILLLLGAIGISCGDNGGMTEDEVRAEVYDIFSGTLGLAHSSEGFTVVSEWHQELLDTLEPAKWKLEPMEDGIWHIEGPGALEREGTPSPLVERILSREGRIGRMPEPSPGLWLFSERDNSLMPYDDAAVWWADYADFASRYGRWKASEAED
jgi:hypothetical protein